MLEERQQSGPGARCDMAFIVPMHRNKPNVTYFGPGAECIKHTVK